MDDGVGSVAGGFRRDTHGSDGVRRLLDSLDDAVFELDPAGEFVGVNAELLAATGYERDSLLGEHVTVLPVAEDEAPLERALERLRSDSSADVSPLEVSVETATGETLRWELQLSPLLDGEELVGTAGVARDVSEEPERQQELERQERLIEALGDGVYAIDEDAEFTMVNDAFCELTGWEREELLGRPSTVVIDDEIAARAAEETDAVAAGEQDVGVLEHTLIRKDGERIPVETRFRPFPGDDGGRCGVVRDIGNRRERERAARQSERRYRTLIDNFPGGTVGLFDEELRYTVVGGQAFDVLDYSPADREGRRIPDIHPDSLVEEIEPHFRAALAGETRQFEVEHGGRHLAATTLPIEGDDGEVDTGMVVIQDVTERREAQREVRESEAKFRMLAENIDEIVWMATAGGDAFQYVNPAFEDVWGLDRETLYDDPMAFLEVVHPEDRERVCEQFEALPEERFDDEFRIVRPDGEERWIYAEGARVHDEDTGMARVIGVGLDITDRKRRERERERSERRYRALVENFPNGAVGLVDEEMRYVAVGGIPLTVGGQNREQLEGDHIRDALTDEMADVLAPRYRAALEGESSTLTYTFDEVDRHARFHFFPVRGDDGEVFAAMGMSQDITDQVRRERKLEESNERLKQFAYAASHDLQEPLRMVSSYLTLIEDRYGDQLDEEGREFLEFAVDGAERMREMIHGLLDYSRVGTRGDPFEPVDLENVVADVCTDLELSIEESEAEVAVGELPRVTGDRGQLSQLFQNLLGNAIEYSGDTPPEVRVSAADRGDEWAITVADDGIGMDPDQADRAFELFQQLHPESDGGTGIGLALCKRIVERHGGDIAVETAPGEGATFTVALPKGEQDD